MIKPSDSGESANSTERLRTGFGNPNPRLSFALATARTKITVESVLTRMRESVAEAGFRRLLAHR